MVTVLVVSTIVAQAPNIVYSIEVVKGTPHDRSSRQALLLQD